MKLAVLATLAASAAFAPSREAKTSATSLAAFESELGAQPPLGFFDPLGLLDEAGQTRFDRLRYVEIKNGRICQLAFLGNIIPRVFQFPGNIDQAGDAFNPSPPGQAALFGPDSIPTDGKLQMLFFVGFLEIFVMKDVTGENEFVGDFRNGFLDFGWDNFDENEFVGDFRNGFLDF